MLKITSTWHVVLYAVLATIVAMILTVIMITSVQPPHILEYTLYRAPVMAAFIAFPLMLFAASKIRLANELALKLVEMVNRDHLTGAATRLFFMEKFGNKARVSGVTMMVDIDLFKAINDTHGHFVGDTVIKEVARLLAEECREQDVVSRFGGEEFAVFLVGADVDRGLLVAERMRSKIADHRFESELGAFQVTVSIGLSDAQTYKDVETALKAADHSLYLAKSTGRNRVEPADPTGVTQFALSSRQATA